MNTISTNLPAAAADSLLNRPLPGQSAAGEQSGEGFAAALGSAVSRVDQLQASADQQVAQMLEGRGADLHQTLIAVEKADLSFQLMMQVRNKIVSAYEEIARMQF